MANKNYSTHRGIPFWYILLIVFIPLWILLVMFLYWLRGIAGRHEVVRVLEIEVPGEERPPEPVVLESTEESQVIEEAAPETPSQPDDLTKIEGIGPKTSTILNQSGISTYASLAAADPARLKQIMMDAGLAFINPSTWPEQAGLAANAQWDALGSLQAQLKGGRRRAK